VHALYIGLAGEQAARECADQGSGRHNDWRRAGSNESRSA
jgi:hypothetical protein